MKFKPLSVKKLKTYSIKSRKSKVNISDFAKPAHAGKTFYDFLNSLPNILAVKDLREIASLIASACNNKKIVIAAMGAHVIKV